MSKGQSIGYVRVSTLEQNTDRQLDGVELDRVFEDRVSGKDINRPELTAMLAHAREGDTVHVHSLDRLARNLSDLRAIVTELTDKGVTVVFEREGLTFRNDSTDPMSMLLLNVMGAFAEFERSLILSRQREGIALAKAAGKYTGRKRQLSDEQAHELRQERAGGIGVSELARRYGISRQSVYAYLERTA